MLLALLLAAIPVPQVPLLSDPALADALGKFETRPGAWVEYAVLPKQGPQTRLKISVLAPALPDGRYWLETAVQREDGPPMALKMLLHGAPGKIENMERLYMYMGGQAPLEVPLDQVRARDIPTTGIPEIEHKGTENLELAAGTFRCEVLQFVRTRIFRSAKVPLWGLVRALAPGLRVELIGFANKGAETVFPAGFDDADAKAAQGNGSERVK